MTQENKTIGHLSAITTIFLWGTTYISTKILLKDFSPIEILFFRFAIGCIILMIAYPHRLRITVKKHELYFALAGFIGVTLFFLIENSALTYSTASNVGVIVCISPFFTAIFSHFLFENEKLKPQFFLGFIIAIAGVFLISFKGNGALHLNLLGDSLAFFAAILWAAYSVLTKKISSFGYHTIQSTRKLFFYGILFMIPFLYLFGFKLDFSHFSKVSNVFNIVYLGIGASAICFVTWNVAIKILGVTKTSIYIYVVPAITIVTAAIILKEEITWFSIIGAGLTLMGLYLSQSSIKLFIGGKVKV